MLKQSITYIIYFLYFYESVNGNISMNKNKTFKLIVTATDNCLEICRYLNKNVIGINKLGVRVTVEKINTAEFDEEMVEILRKKGITRLPTLIAPDGKLFIGLKTITNLFEKNLRGGRTMDRFSPMNGEYNSGNAELGSNPSMTDFWMRELFTGMDKRGKFIPRKDKDDPDDESEDLTKRMNEYRRREPRHRRQDSERERDLDPPVKTRRRVVPVDDNVEETVNRDEFGDDESEEEYDLPPRKNVPKISTSGDARGDDMDQRMLAAWLDNNPSTE